jgi:hydroxyacyl-ACP dehydratase HTD2-like protein with hotdog domain
MDTTRFADIKVGDELPVRSFTPDNVQLMMYNAALWNAHRIHFDHPYATEVEGYPGLVIAGPLLGDWLNQCVVDWVGDDGVLASIEYSNRKASYIGETLRSRGRVLALRPELGEVELEVTICNEADEVIAPGVAIARFHPVKSR